MVLLYVWLVILFAVLWIFYLAGTDSSTELQQMKEKIADLERISPLKKVTIKEAQQIAANDRKRIEDSLIVQDNKESQQKELIYESITQLEKYVTLKAMKQLEAYTMNVTNCKCYTTLRDILHKVSDIKKLLEEE